MASCADLSFGSPPNPDYRVELALQIQEGSVHLICDAVQVFDYVSFSPNRDYRFVDAVAVLPRVQRQGLGTQMSQRKSLRWDCSRMATWLPRNRPLR